MVVGASTDWETWSACHAIERVHYFLQLFGTGHGCGSHLIDAHCKARLGISPDPAVLACATARFHHGCGVK